MFVGNVYCPGIVVGEGPEEASSFNRTVGSLRTEQALALAWEPATREEGKAYVRERGFALSSGLEDLRLRRLQVAVGPSSPLRAWLGCLRLGSMHNCEKYKYEIWEIIVEPFAKFLDTRVACGLVNMGC